MRRAPSPPQVQAHCEGVVPLSARLEPWMSDLCGTPELVDELIETYGSPVNLLDPSPMGRNVDQVTGPADRRDVDMRIYFARKANKALAFVDEAVRLGLGVDLASERELIQVLDRDVPAERLVMTAAVKPLRLIELCIASGTTIVVDNDDEARQVDMLADRQGTTASVALRLAPDLMDDRTPTRFGFDISDAISAEWSRRLRIDGVHFHLDGYDPADRVAAIAQSLALVDALRGRGHRPAFLDIGGGLPVDYLASSDQWDRFWFEHRRGLLGDREPLTFEAHGLGLIGHRGEIIGRPNVYPYHQTLTRGPWMTQVLDGQITVGGRSGSVAAHLRDRGLQLRCEPGRALLDGCGMTVARVAYRKARRDGTWLIGVEMNRTQCRSTSDDFLVDPLLIRPDAGHVPSGATGAIEGYLVGAYCIEKELLTWRRLSFAHGVAVGDIVVFPNTAGYLMHILESSSHQIPLARNVVVDASGSWALDPIDDAGR